MGMAAARQTGHSVTIMTWYRRLAGRYSPSGPVQLASSVWWSFAGPKWLFPILSPTIVIIRVGDGTLVDDQDHSRLPVRARACRRTALRMTHAPVLYRAPRLGVTLCDSMPNCGWCLWRRQSPIGLGLVSSDRAISEVRIRRMFSFAVSGRRRAVPAARTSTMAMKTSREAEGL